MPKPRSDLDSRISGIIREHVDELVATIEQAVRQDLVNDLQSFLSNGRERASLPERAGAAAPTRAQPRRILPCIAPGCKNASKGPRFHYLCEKHKDASRKDYEAWRKMRKEPARREGGKPATD